MELFKRIAWAGANRASAKDHDERIDWDEKLKTLEKILPSGSGFDNGTQIVEANDEKIILKTSYHHLNDVGMYIKWTEHIITIKPSFMWAFEITRISGENYDDIKGYIGDVFFHALRKKIESEGIHGEVPTC